MRAWLYFLSHTKNMHTDCRDESPTPQLLNSPTPPSYTEAPNSHNMISEKKTQQIQTTLFFSFPRNIEIQSAARTTSSFLFGVYRWCHLAGKLYQDFSKPWLRQRSEKSSKCWLLVQIQMKYAIPSRGLTKVIPVVKRQSHGRFPNRILHALRQTTIR